MELNEIDTLMKNPENIIFSETMSVRMSDVNYGNHLDFAALVRMLGDVRALFFKKNGYHELNIGGYGTIATDLRVNYRKEAYFNDTLEISLFVNRASKLKADLCFQIEKQSTLEIIATAIITLVFYDYQRKKVVSIPDEFLEIAKVSKKYAATENDGT